MEFDEVVRKMLRAAGQKLPPARVFYGETDIVTVRYDDEVTVRREVEHRPPPWPGATSLYYRYLFQGVGWTLDCFFDGNMIEHHDLLGVESQFQKWFVYARLRGDFDG